MANGTHTPGEVAKMLGVTAMTVRRYCDRFGVAHLSKTASPPPKQPRLLTDSDVYKLRMVHQWTQQGKSYDEVDGLLHALPLVEDAPLPASSTAIEAAPAQIPEGLAILQRVGDALQQVAAQDERLGSLTTIADRHTQEITRLTNELTALKAARDRRTTFAMAALPWLVLAVIGLVIVVLILVFMRPG